MLDLVSIYPDAALRAAFAAAVELHACTPAFVRGLLERGPTRAEAPQRLHVVLAAVPTVQVARPLTVYQEILRGGRA